MQTFKKNIGISSCIFICLFIALIPVILSNNYIRQDDLMWEIWPGMKISDFGFLYYNTVFQLVRPLCMLSFYITDLISIDIQSAVYVRLIGLILIGILGILLYFWQLKFNPNRILAMSFAISAFTLPAYQVFAATGNYSLIITALLLTFISIFFWHAAFNADIKLKKRYYIYGCILFFASLLEYPLSSMYVWALLAICYLNNLNSTNSLQVQRQRFIYLVSALSIALMCFYYFFSRLMHLIFHVHLGPRSSVIDTHDIFVRLFRIFDVLSWHADLWLWKDTHSFMHWSIILITSVTFLALLRIQLTNNYNASTIIFNILKSFGVLFSLFFLAYSPVLATPELIITFRYALVTMPILLYLLYWSLTIIFNGTPISTLTNITLISITICGMVYANVMLADGIVGPHEHDFTYIQQILTKQVVPLLKNNQQVIINGIACDEDSLPLGPYIPASFEYGMRICQYQQQVIGVIIHSLTKMGYPSNYRQHNHVIYNDKQIIVKDTPWGTLVVNSSSNAKQTQQEFNKRTPFITIDTRTIPQYEQFDFYKNLLKKIWKI